MAEKLQAFKESKVKGVMTTGRGREGQRGNGGKDNEEWLKERGEGWRGKEGKCTEERKRRTAKKELIMIAMNGDGKERKNFLTTIKAEYWIGQWGRKH